MNRSEIKSRKGRLREIEDHLRFAHNAMGVERDSVGFVEVVHHPSYELPALNYVIPRRKTAFVPSKHVEDGVGTLRDYRRSARVLYVEELFPPFFGDALEKIGLTLTARFPLWVIDTTQEIPPPRLPATITVNQVVNQKGMAIWGLIWRNHSNYQVFVTPLEPLQVGEQTPRQERVIDVILYLRHSPIAVARLSIHDKTAHLMARALVETTRSLRLHQWLIQVAIQTAREEGCELLFICSSEIDHLLPTTDLSCRLDGSMLCYTESIDDTHGEDKHDTVEQPVLLTEPF